MTLHTADIVIIGAGMAGASLAAELAGSAHVVVLEMEDRPGFHSTGRSAAMFVPTYGPPGVLSLTRTSDGFLSAPPDGFCDGPILSPRGETMLIRPGEEAFAAEAVDAGLTPIALDALKRRIPLLRTEALIAAFIDEAARDIDVDLLHQGYLRAVRRAGGRIVCDAPVTALERTGAGWTAVTKAGRFSAPVVVDAAGAWAGEVARLAGAAPIAIQPKRRSAALVTLPPEARVDGWPLAFGAGESFYFRPMGGKLMISPADATPVDPHDAWADDMALAEAIDLFQQVVDHEVTHVEHTWAGLRSFAPDGEPVVGFDPRADGFFWLAGQGGYGIQTAPALARAAAALIRGEPWPADIAAEGLGPATLSPARFAA